MSDLFLLAHPQELFQTDFLTAGTHVVRPSCHVCERNLNGKEAPFLYEWEDEFGTPDVSMASGHHCFWGDFLLMVTVEGKTQMEALGIPLEFVNAKPVKTRLVRSALIIEDLPPPAEKLFWAKPTFVADADPARSHNEICPECGLFQKPKRQLEGLTVLRSDATSQGIFSVRQNRVFAPIFVSEEMKTRLGASGLRGIGFYYAGMLV